jgi:RNA polymerase sigma-70 factor (ECF subfamily)
MARNAAVDQLRHRQVAATDSLGNIEQLPVVEERPHVADLLTREHEIAILHEAIAALPARCREILRLRRFEELSHREIASRLGISVNTVDAQLCLAVLRCRQFLLVRGIARERLAHFPAASRT